MAATGTEYLKRLKAESERGLGEVLMETLVPVGLVTIMLELNYPGWDRQDWNGAMRLLPLFGPILLWAVIAMTLYLLAHKAYLRHYRANFDRGELLLTLLDTSADASFAERTREFIRRYPRHARVNRLPAFPVGWRLVTSVLLGAAIFAWGYFLIMAVGYYQALSLALVFKSAPLVRIGSTAVGTTLVWLVLDRPRMVALRGALAEALLRHWK